MQHQRRSLVLAGLALAAAAPPVASQTRRGSARIGWLGWTGMGQAQQAPLDALRAGLRERGWVEGRNLQILTRTGDRTQAGALAAELVAAKVEVIVAQGPMIFGARNPADTTPLVFAINGDPVEAGLVPSLARPGGNVTGITALALALAGKRLELLREVRPGLSRVVVLANAIHPGVQAELRETRASAQRLGVDLKYVPVSGPKDFEGAFAAIAGMDAQGLLAFPDTLINAQAKAIAEFATPRHLPTVSGWAEFTEAGNLMSYGPSLTGYFSHLAVHVSKLLNGTKAAELPVEQPTVFELVVNLQAAKAMGVAVPKALLVRADVVIQ